MEKNTNNTSIKRKAGRPLQYGKPCRRYVRMIPADWFELVDAFIKEKLRSQSK